MTQDEHPGEFYPTVALPTCGLAQVCPASIEWQLVIIYVAVGLLILYQH